MLNKDIIEGKWKEIKGDILKTWGNLTDDEVDKGRGNLSDLEGTIQRKYGETKEDISRKFNSIFSKYSDDTADEDLANRDRIN